LVEVETSERDDILDRLMIPFWEPPTISLTG
jgi:hypothetical protein